jgi:hypothetical protein
MLKYLRITVTALSLTACVLLVALWVRSYYTIDVFQYRISAQHVFGIGSHSGQCNASKFLSNVWPKTWGYFHHEVVSPLETDTDVAFDLSPVLIVQRWGPNNITIFSPHWLVASLFMVIAAVTGLRWRFSLRTLLIATTLVAVTLGVVIYLAR